MLNAVASLRGHQGPSDVAYGPLARQRFDVYVPGNSIDEADKATGSPLVIFIYGGSWNMGSRRDYRFAGEALAAQGFTVMVVDYRLYPEVSYPDFLQDCAQAVGYGLEHARELGADPRRVFLYGHSAGAYNVAMLALDPRWLRAAGHSPDELAGWVGLAGPYNFLPIVDAGVQARVRLARHLARHAADQPRRRPRAAAAGVPRRGASHDKAVVPRAEQHPAGGQDEGARHGRHVQDLRAREPRAAGGLAAVAADGARAGAGRHRGLHARRRAGGGARRGATR